MEAKPSEEVETAQMIEQNESSVSGVTDCQRTPSSQGNESSLSSNRVVTGLPQDVIRKSATDEELHRSSPDRTYSASSGSTGVVGDSRDNKETINGPLDMERSKQLNASMKVKTVQITLSDSASLGSTTSLLDSVGAATLAEQRLHAAQSGTASQKNTIPPAAQQTPLAGVNISQSASDISQQDQLPPAANPPQHVVETKRMPQTPPLSVDVPLQQPSDEAAQHEHSQQSQAGQSARNHDEQSQLPPQPQTQQALLYQIPGVVTLPVGHNNMSLDGQIPQGQPSTSAAQQQIATVGDLQDQVVGMVGGIPIVKLHGGALHLVTKKKGRFKFLQESPTVPPAAVSAAESVNAASSSGTPQAAQIPMATQGQGQLPSNLTENQSMASTFSQLTIPVSAAVTPQTFDGSNVPVVKKKGRFVVTSIRDPASLTKNMQYPSTGSLPPAENGVVAQPAGQSIQAVTPQQQHANQPANPHPPQVVAQLAIPTSGEVPQNYTPQEGVDVALKQRPSNGSANGNASPRPPQQQQVETAMHQQQPPPPQVQQPIQNTQPDSLHMQHQSNNQTIADAQATPSSGPYMESAPQIKSNIPGPPLPAMKVAQGSPSRRIPTTTSLPNVPIPRMPQTTEKPSVPTGPAKKPTPKRPTKAPQSISATGIYGTVGLGKVSYFLDQMKSEVSEADRFIKHLQTDMKVLRDKNKELEAKNLGLDRKLKEETALREKAEARCIEFRKKLRAVADVQSNDPKEAVPDSTLRSSFGEISLVASGDVKSENAGSKSDSNSTLNGVGQRDAEVGSSTSNGLPQVSAHKPTTSEQTGQPSSNPETVEKESVHSNTPAATMSLPVPPTTVSKAAGVSLQQVDRPRLEQQNNHDSTVKHGRSNSNGSNVQETDRTETPRTPTLSKKIGTPPVRRSDGSTPPLPPTPQPLPPQVARPSVGASQPGHRASTLSGFDPLGRSATPALSGDVVPVFSIPTNVSLDAVPIGSTAEVFQNASGQAYSTATANAAFFMSENPYVVPISFGMTAQSLASTGSLPEQLATNGFHMQQAIMVQQGHHPGQLQSNQNQPIQPSNPFDPMT